MNKTYKVVTANGFEAEFVNPSARDSLASAMAFAARCVARGVHVTVMCNGDIVWTSQGLI